jgi:DNA topoisomerase IA
MASKSCGLETVRLKRLTLPSLGQNLYGGVVLGERGSKRGAAVGGMASTGGESDAGREGEMIERAGSRMPVQRFWSSALTDGALRKAAAELLSASRKLPLYHAGRARSRADRIEGLTYARYFTRRTHTPPKAKPLSVGRIQSAVTALSRTGAARSRISFPTTSFEITAVLDTAQGPLRLV